MTLEELKAELLSASPEVREELFTFLGAWRRAQDPARSHRLAERLDNPQGWVSEEDAAGRLGLTTEE